MRPLPRLKRPAPRRFVTGLDIEPGCVRAAQVELGPDGALRVTRAGERALEPGVVRDGEVVDAEALAGALRELFEQHGFDNRVRLGLANQRVVVRTLVLPPIDDPRELAAAVRFQAADEIPIPLDQAVLDHASLGLTQTPEGPRLRVLLVAARRDMIERLLGAARDAGLRPEGVDLAAFAMVRALSPRSAGTVLHLAVGGTVNLAVAAGGECVFTRVLPGGTEAMAIDLAERREMPVEEARSALLAVPSAGDPATGTEPAEPADAATRRILADGARRIATEVRTSVDFHLAGGTGRSDVAAEGIERVLLTGPAAAIPGFAEALAERLALPVEIGAVAGVDGDADSRYAVAAGLAVEEVAA